MRRFVFGVLIVLGIVVTAYFLRPVTSIVRSGAGLITPEIELNLHRVGMERDGRQ